MFTDVLRSLRKKHGDTQESLAAKINVPVRTYASWERSERIMPNDVLVSIADLYDVSVDYLLGREELPAPVLAVDDFLQRPQSTPPLMLDGGGIKGWLEDRPETQKVAAEVMAEALKNGMTKEEVLAFITYYAQLFPEEKKYIMGSMRFLRSQHNAEEGT